VDPNGLADAVDDDFCYLTTRGRRTGRDHEIEIWFALDGSTLYLLAGAGEQPDWVRNLLADPRAKVRVRARTYQVTGRVVTAGTPEEARARDLVFTKYQVRSEGSLADWRERSLPVALDLDS
jgi:deazaflavin-dependent oxidoreductase (nitroreductase family)